MHNNEAYFVTFIANEHEVVYTVHNRLICIVFAYYGPDPEGEVK